jgi:hypothetical protein
MFAWDLGLYQGMIDPGDAGHFGIILSLVIQSGDPYSIVTSRRIAVDRSVAEHYLGLAFGDLRKINTGGATMSALGH